MTTASSNFGFLLQLIGTGGIPAVHVGTGDPEGSETGNIGDIYLRTDGGPGNSLYLKQAGGAGNTGWVSAGPAITDDLTAQVTGTTAVFTLNGGAKAYHNTTLGIQMRVSLNGIEMREGAGNDWTASESGGAGTGFDTITFNTTPGAGYALLVEYLPR